MTTIPELHRRGVDQFSQIVARIPDDAWDRPTPCTEWDVRALLHHNVYENLWMPPLMTGATIEEVGDRFDGDVLGADPAAAWVATAEPACDVVEADRAMERTVHLSFGDLPGAEFLKQRIVDLVVHAWDLAEGAGVGVELDSELLESCLRWGQDWKPLLATMSDYFDPPIEPDPDADQLTRVLNLFGRRP